MTLNTIMNNMECGLKFWTMLPWSAVIVKTAVKILILGGRHSTEVSICPSHPAAQGSILGIPKNSFLMLPS